MCLIRIEVSKINYSFQILFKFVLKLPIVCFATDVMLRQPRFRASRASLAQKLRGWFYFISSGEFIWHVKQI